MTEDLLKLHQKRLADLGYYTGLIDGLDGPLTKLAIDNFKTKHDLPPQPYLSRDLIFKIWSNYVQPYKAPPGQLPWIQEAKSLIGVKEIPGPNNNPIIMQWAEDIDQYYLADSVAWCGLFVAHCMRVGAPKDVQNFNRLSAQEWLKYGQPLKDPIFGCIVVFWREAPTSWKGHVGFLVGEDESTWYVLGGNQSDAVSVKRFDKGRTKGFRWPATVEIVEQPLPFKVLTNESLSIREE